MYFIACPTISRINCDTVISLLPAVLNNHWFISSLRRIPMVFTLGSVVGLPFMIFNLLYVGQNIIRISSCNSFARSGRFVKTPPRVSASITPKRYLGFSAFCSSVASIRKTHVYRIDLLISVMHIIQNTMQCFV